MSKDEDSFIQEPDTPDETEQDEWAVLYTEFAEEDRQLAEEGMADYLAGLANEDAAL